jgi:capsular polysaccharide biosynthesis protein
MNSSAGSPMNTTLVSYSRILRDRWRWMLWGVLLALAATTVMLIVQPPLYRSQATVFVRTPGDVSHVVDGGDSYAQTHARTYASLVGSPSIATRVIADLGLDLDPATLSGRIEGANRPGTALIDIAVRAPAADEARQTATVLLTEYTATVRALETVPGSLVPRAELVVVDPPSAPVRVVAWGAPVLPVLGAAALIGLVLGALGAVLRSTFGRSAGDRIDVAQAERVPQ